jgi:hypothetical protein
MSVQGAKVWLEALFLYLASKASKYRFRLGFKKKAICLLTKYKSRTKLGVKRYFNTSKMFILSSSNPQIYHKLQIMWSKSSAVVEMVALLQRFREVKSSNLGPETSQPETFFVLSVPTSKCQKITVSLHVISDSIFTDHPTIRSTDSVDK